MPFSIRGEVEGLGPVLSAMQGMKLGLRNKALRRGITKATRLVRKSARAKLKTKSGNNILKRSLDVKIWVKGDFVMGIVGPRREKVQVGTATTAFVTTRTKKDGTTVSVERKAGDAIYEDASKIAHFVENGRPAVTVKSKTVLSSGEVFYGKKVEAVPARPFMRPAWDENKNALPKIIGDECWIEIAKWARH